MYKCLAIHSKDRIGKISISFLSFSTLTAAQLSTNSGFGAIHLAILGLSARCMGLGDTLFSQIAPQTELEFQLNQQYAFGTLCIHIPFSIPTINMVGQVMLTVQNSM